MKTNRLLLATTALLFTAAAASFAAIPMMANPMMGTWKLNEAKSKFSPGATKNHTVSYTEAKGGKTMVTVDGMDFIRTRCINSLSIATIDASSGSTI